MNKNKKDKLAIYRRESHPEMTSMKGDAQITLVSRELQVTIIIKKCHFTTTIKAKLKI